MRSIPMNMLVTIAGLAIFSILVSACASGSEATEQQMAGVHSVPEDAAAVPNPIAGDEDSVATGAELYAIYCAVCHGKTGEGDGPAASGLEKPPANLHASHVQENTDGALFYIISNGRPDTPMPAWDNVLDEDQRWHVVNFLRTFE
ncbi:MAG: cytochrome c [Anaerolineales bacterium]